MKKFLEEYGTLLLLCLLVTVLVIAVFAAMGWIVPVGTPGNGPDQSLFPYLSHW